MNGSIEPPNWTGAVSHINVELLMERMALLSQRIENLQQRIVEHQSKHFQTEDLEQILLTLLATRSVFGARLTQIETARYGGMPPAAIGR